MSKSSSATPLLAAVGVGAVLLALNLLFAPDPPPVAPGPGAAPVTEGAPPAGSTDPPDAPEVPDATEEEAPRREGPDRSRSVLLPEPDASARPEAAGSAAEATPSAASGQVEPEQIRDAVQDVTPGIQECMEGWWAVDPELEGRLVMDFTLTPDGLGEVRVLEHDDVPFGVQTCFASAIYEADWPRPATGELQVTYPFLFSPDDPEAGEEAAVDTGA